MRRSSLLAVLFLGLFWVVIPSAYGTIYCPVYIESDEESLTGITSIVITLNDPGSAGRPFWSDTLYLTTQDDPAGTATDVGIPDLTGAAGADWVRDGPWADGKISYSGTDPLSPGILDGYDMSDDDLVVTDVEVIGWEGTVTFSVSDLFVGWGAYDAKSLTITLTADGGGGGGDTTAPVIELTGDASVAVELNGAYTEEGATATDDVDGDVTVTIGGDTVDSTTVGVYTVTYDASGVAGNAATQVTRTVTVAEAGADTTAPVITLTGDASVAVELNGTYTEEGATATDDVDGDVAVTVGGDTVDTSTIGTYTITYTATDAADNTASATRTVIVVEALFFADKIADAVAKGDLDAISNAVNALVALGLSQGELGQEILNGVNAAASTERQKWDAKGDGRIGLEEAIYALQVVAGVRSPLYTTEGKMNLAILLVDYETYALQGGNVSHYELCDSCDDEGLPFEAIYQSPMDFGSMKFIYTETGDTVFDATIIWAGRGNIGYPSTFLEPGAFGLETVSEALPPDVDYYAHDGLPWTPDQDTIERTSRAWDAVNNLDIVHAYAEKPYRVGFYLYPPTLGVFDPSVAQWVVFVYLGD